MSILTYRYRLRCLLPAAAIATVVLSAAVGGAGAATPQFPLTVHAANGAVTIPKRPSRIISLSATATEVLDLLDLTPARRKSITCPASTGN